MNKIKNILMIGHDNAGSSQIFEHIVRNSSDFDFKLIEAKGLYYGMSYMSSIIKLIKEASWIFILVRFFELVRHKMYGATLRQLSLKYKIPRVTTYDVNSKKIVELVKSMEIDLIISLFTMQIYKDRLIKIPKYGFISSHPSILPNYRGLEVFFWVLANNEKETGVSVFFVKENIDSGDVIWQKKILIHKNTSVASLYKEITYFGAKGLIESINLIQKNKLKYFKKTGKGSYYSMPDSDSVKRFLKLGKRFF